MLRLHGSVIEGGRRLSGVITRKASVADDAGMIGSCIDTGVNTAEARISAARIARLR